MYGILLTLAMALSIQGVSWHTLTVWLKGLLRTSDAACIRRADLPWLEIAFFYHWFTRSQAMMLQDEPRRSCY